MSQARFVVDNSVVMAWCFSDESSEYADSALEALEEHEAVVPAIWPLEVGNMLLVAERKRRLNKTAVVRFLDLLNCLPLSVEQESPQRMLTNIVALARDTRLSTHDASYLDLALRLDVPLATQDKLLKKAAKKHRVPLFNCEMFKRKE